MPETTQQPSRDWKEDWKQVEAYRHAKTLFNRTIHTMHRTIEFESDTELLAYWMQEYKKKSELYDELKEQYASEKKRADVAVERERRLQELLGRILKKTDGYSAYSNEAYIHSWIREVQRSLYGETL